MRPIGRPLDSLKIRPFSLATTCRQLHCKHQIPGASLKRREYPQQASIRVVCLVQAPITLCCMRPKALIGSLGPGTNPSH